MNSDRGCWTGSTGVQDFRRLPRDFQSTFIKTPIPAVQDFRDRGVRLPRRLQKERPRSIKAPGVAYTAFPSRLIKARIARKNGTRSGFRIEPEKNPLPEGWEGRRRPGARPKPRRTKRKEPSSKVTWSSRSEPQKNTSFRVETSNPSDLFFPLYSRRNVHKASLNLFSLHSTGES